MKYFLTTGLVFSILFMANTPPLLAQPKTWSLKECIDQAIQQNIVLNQNELNNEINHINYKQAKANQLPNLNFSDNQSAGFGHNYNASINQNSNQNTTYNNMSLNSSITIYNGLKNINLVKESRLNFIAGNLDIEKMKNDLMLNVVAAYMQVLFEYEAVNIAQTQIDVTKEHLNYTEKYVKAGSLSESNLLQMQAQLASDNSIKVSAEIQLQLAKVILIQLMEIPVTDVFEIERPDIKEINPDITLTSQEIYHTAENSLPEVKSAAIKTEAANYNLKIAKSEVMPKLTLTGNLATSYSSNNSLVAYHSTSNITNIGYLGTNPSELVYGPVTTTSSSNSNYPFYRQFGDNFGQGLALNLTIPIFNNLSYKSDIERSKVTLRVARLNETATKNQLRKNIEQAYTDLVAAGKNYTATQQQMIAEARSYHDITIKFRAGIINITDFFVEKSNYSKAEMAMLQAKYEYIFKTKMVAFYTGNPITP